MGNMKYKEIITNENLEVSKIFPQSEMYDTTIIPKYYAFYIAKGKNGIVNINNV